MTDKIIIKGARENNLKNIDVEIPRDKLVVLTGLSGSGKSSLAFDTIYAEGQRRYVESLSSYARQFLGQMEKPDVDYIEGLSPAISIDQKTTSKNPRSTVGTVTEVYDYLRLLWARIGTPHCPKCGREIKQQSIDQMTDQIMAMPEGTRIQILAPVIRARKGEHTKVFEDAKKSGYVRARVDGSMYELGETIELDKNKKHSIEIIVDRIIVRDGVRQRLTDSMETALALAGGIAIVNLIKEEKDVGFLAELRLRGLRHLDRGTGPAHVLVQHAIRRVSHLPRARLPAQGRSRHDNPRQIAFDNGRGDNSQRLGQHTRRQYRAHVLRGAGEAVSFFTLNAR